MSGRRRSRHDGARDERPLTVRLKTKKKRTVSQKRWLERQLNDPYVARAKREGLRSRAAYKLIEIDDKHRVLKPGGRVVDLGAAPGGWSEIAAKRVGARTARARWWRSTFWRWRRSRASMFRQLDFLDPAAPEAPARDARRRGRRRALRHGGERDRPQEDRPAQDHGAGRGGRPSSPARCCARAAASSPRCCRAAPTRRCSRHLKRDFASVKHVKPQASRADSSELYLLATGFSGR